MLSASDKKNIFVTVKIGILTLLGQIFLAVGSVTVYMRQQNNPRLELGNQR
jgi:hypothetical protein